MNPRTIEPRFTAGLFFRPPVFLSARIPLKKKPLRKFVSFLSVRADSFAVNPVFARPFRRHSD
jgi:hypothetical protein